MHAVNPDVLLRVLETPSQKSVYIEIEPSIGQVKRHDFSKTQAI